MKPSNLIKRTAYYVHAFPIEASGYMSEYKITGVIKSEFTDSLFFTATRDGFDTELSVMDCNVNPNTYNSHRMFTSKRRAKAYLKRPELWHPKGITKKQWRAAGFDEYARRKNDDYLSNTMFYA